MSTKGTAGGNGPCASARIAPGERARLRVFNNIDLAPHVGAILVVMARDTRRVRGARPNAFTNLRCGEGLGTIVNFIAQNGGPAA